MKLNNGMTVVSIPDMSGLTNVQKEWWNKWIEALEGGKYEQGRCQLSSEGKFCCLGVVQDLIKDEIGCKWIDGTPTYATFTDATRTYRSSSGLIRPAEQVLGVNRGYCISVATIDSSASGIKDYGLDQLNDNGVTFLEIAAILRKALEGGLKS